MRHKIEGSHRVVDEFWGFQEKPMPFVTSSVALVSTSFLFLVVRPGAPSSFLCLTLPLS